MQSTVEDPTTLTSVCNRFERFWVQNYRVF